MILILSSLALAFACASIALNVWTWWYRRRTAPRGPTQVRRCPRSDEPGHPVHYWTHRGHPRRCPGYDETESTR